MTELREPLSDLLADPKQLPLQLGDEGFGVNPPVRLRKAAALVHSFAIKGKYSFFTRKVYNALLAATLRRWNGLSEEEKVEILEKRIVREFHGSVAELRRILEIPPENRDYDRFYEAMERCEQLEFFFNKMDDKGDWTMRGRLVGPVGRIETEPGRIRWEFSPDVFAMIVNPGIYAVLNFKLMNSVSSGYTLAMYENLIRYIDNPSHLSARRPVSEWMLLLMGSDEGYNKEYKYFKRYVLKVAMDELNASSACPVNVALIEFSRGKKVVELQFRVEMKTQIPLPTEIGRSVHPVLERQMRELGLDDIQLNSLICKYEERYLEEKLFLLQSEASKGGVKSPKAWFLSACQEDYENAASVAKRREQESNKRRESEVKAKLGAQAALLEATNTAKDYFRQLAEDDQQHLRVEFTQLGATPEHVKQDYAKKGERSSMFHGMLYAWLAESPAYLSWKASIEASATAGPGVAGVASSKRRSRRKVASG
jgi:hypothetical protein